MPLAMREDARMAAFSSGDSPTDATGIALPENLPPVHELVSGAENTHMFRGGRAIDRF